MLLGTRIVHQRHQYVQSGLSRQGGIAHLLPCLPARHACLVALWLLAGAAFAESTDATQITAEAGWGYEKQTSPLVRISPQGTLIRIDGQQQAGGAHLRAGAQGFTSWSLNDEWSASLAGNASQKRAPNAAEFDFGTVAVQPAIHVALGSSSLGWGMTLQHIDVAGQAFRDIRSMQADWTLADPDGSHWTIVADAGVNRHPGEFADLDASTASLMMQRHWAKPLVGIDAFDIAAYFSRERNQKDFNELSNRAMMLSASMQWRWQNITWSAGSFWQVARFDATAFAEEALRRDRAFSRELSAEHALSAKHTLRVEFSDVRNKSTTQLYDNHYQQLAITIHSTW